MNFSLNEDVAPQWQWVGLSPDEVAPQPTFGATQQMPWGAEGWMSVNTHPMVTMPDPSSCTPAPEYEHAAMAPGPVAASMPSLVLVPTFSSPFCPTWQSVPNCTPLEEFPTTHVQEVEETSQTSSCPSHLVLNLAGLTCADPTCWQAFLASGCCTPEITPRHADIMSAQIAAKLAELAEIPDPCKCTVPPLHENVPTDYESSECASTGNDYHHVCWDFDFQAALLVRARHNASMDACSDASTAVSRSSRRRRGRRAAKLAANPERRHTIGILESPPTNELLVTLQKQATLVKQLELGGDAMHTVVANISGSVLRMSLEPFGCRVVQSALDVAGAAEKDSLARELRGHVHLAITSPHANFVLQKVVEVLPARSTNFVAEELATYAAEVAQHRFGCRVISRLIEHHSSDSGESPATTDLVNELLIQTDQLIRHNFARHVLELVFEHGSEAHKQRICQTIRTKPFYYAKDRCSSYVVEKALMLSNRLDAMAISSELLDDPAHFRALAVHECGVHVVRAVIRLSEDCAKKAGELLRQDLEVVKSTKYGKRLLEEVSHAVE